MDALADPQAVAGDEQGQVEVNGAAARMAERGDVVIVISYALCAEDERPEPTVLLSDEENGITERK